ncbi:hypothetical protein LX32DRAFT_332279 [Colletotrichum zoysiae]|uniref:Uncharacterized protein n=1 Tax=Colletotrichum zoysiae TaxID=1216348 RepID=A0AAD9M392_9PEZI|nr:hypothetical protein LX32DRAFT_332279 [Colletotrichum zoysiae]
MADTGCVHVRDWKGSWLFRIVGWCGVLPMDECCWLTAGDDNILHWCSRSLPLFPSLVSEGASSSSSIGISRSRSRSRSRSKRPPPACPGRYVCIYLPAYFTLGTCLYLPTY